MPTNRKFTLVLNGEKKEFETPFTVWDAIVYLKPASLFVAAELNGTILEKSNFANIPLKEGDILEIIQPLGGGES